MPRKRKRKLVDLNLTRTTSRDVTPDCADGLPPFKAFFFITDPGTERRSRVWLDTPSEEERIESKVKGETGRVEIGNVRVRNPIVPLMIDKGISEAFANQIARLQIRFRENQRIGKGTIDEESRALSLFVEFLSARHTEGLREMSLESLSITDFIEFRDYLTKNSIPSAQGRFSAITSLFSQEGLLLSNEVRGIKGGRHFKKARKNKPSLDLTSPLFRDDDEKYYSDGVMFQLLCQFIFDYERAIDNLKLYEEVTEENIRTETGGDFIAPGDNPSKTIPTAKSSIHARSRKNKNLNYHAGDLLQLWLSDEKYYAILLKHELVWSKVYGFNFYDELLLHRKHRAFSKESKTNAMNYHSWVNDRFGLGNYMRDNINLVRVDVILSSNKEMLAKTANKPATILRKRIGYCLVNIILMATGLNREVPLSWDSIVDGKSILDSVDMYFLKAEREISTDISIKGIKRRGGKRAGSYQEITCNIPKASPIYRMLRDYEKYVKVDFDGPFFEFPETFRKHWKFTHRKSKGKKIDVFSSLYPVYLDNGDLLDSLETKKFRKVFGKTALFDLMEEADSAVELAELIQKAFNHGSLDTTLSNYLLKQPDSRHVIDLSIATIMNEKINELRFSGKVYAEDSAPKGKKSVPLCECEDPSKPTHGFTILAECKKYDLCLGCKRSIVTEKHLPYICKRILQYEESRRTVSAANWSAFFEDRWMIARDALQQYAEKFKGKGQRLVDKAWESAKNDQVRLPPIIMTEID